MKMKQNTDWTDVMRSALRDAELPPAEGGWERLQRELDGVEPRLAGTLVPEPRKNVWRIYGPRIAAAAAAVLVCVVAVEMLWRPDKELGDEAHPMIASAVEAGDPAVDGAQLPESASLRERLAEASGWTEAPGVGAESPVEAPAEAPRGEKGTVAIGSTEKGPELLAVATVRQPGTDAAEAERPVQREAEARKAGSEGVLRTDARAEQSAPKAAQTRQPEPSADARPESGQVRQRRAAEAARSRTSTRTAGSAGSFDDPFADPFEARNNGGRTRTKASLALFAGGGMTGGSALQETAMRSYSPMANDAVSLVGNGDNFSPMERRNYDESSFRHHLPLGCGVTVRAELPYGLSLESGVNYTLLRSDVRLRYSSDDVSQKLHFIGVPLRLNWQFVERGRFSAYLGAGGMLEKCISAKFGSENVNEAGVQWSATAAIGAQYRLGEFVGLYFEPEAAYYFTDTELRTSRSDAPLSVSLRVGVRLLF